MAYEKRFFANGGSLFASKNKKNDRAPDLSGNIDLGTDTVGYIIEQYNAGNKEITLDLSAWTKVARSGDKFLSVSIKKPFVKTGAPAKPASSSFEDDDVPF